MRASIIITRPQAAGERLAKQLRDVIGSHCALIRSPVIDIAPVSATLGQTRYRGVLFTSAHGVIHAPEGIGPLPCWCVGDVTARAARDAGYDVKHSAPDAETLLADIATAKIAGPLLHCRGTYARVDLAKRLTAMGIPCDDLVVYAQRSRALSAKARAALGGETPVILPLYSPRSAALVADQGPFAAQITVVAISDAVANQAARLEPVSVIVADHPDGVAMLAAIATVTGTVCPK